MPYSHMGRQRPIGKYLGMLYITYTNNELLDSGVHCTRSYSNSKDVDLSVISSMISLVLVYGSI